MQSIFKSPAGIRYDNIIRYLWYDMIWDVHWFCHMFSIYSIFTVINNELTFLVLVRCNFKTWVSCFPASQLPTAKSESSETARRAASKRNWAEKPRWESVWQELAKFPYGHIDSHRFTTIRCHLAHPGPTLLYCEVCALQASAQTLANCIHLPCLQFWWNLFRCVLSWAHVPSWLKHLQRIEAQTSYSSYTWRLKCGQWVNVKPCLGLHISIVGWWQPSTHHIEAS